MAKRWVLSECPACHAEIDGATWHGTCPTCGIGLPRDAAACLDLVGQRFRPDRVHAAVREDDMAVHLGEYLADHPREAPETFFPAR